MKVFTIMILLAQSILHAYDGVSRQLFYLSSDS